MLLKQTSNPKHSLSLAHNQPGVFFFFFFFMQFSQTSCRTVLRLHVHLPRARKEEQSYNVRPVLRNGATEGQAQEQLVHFVGGPPRAALLRRTTSSANWQHFTVDKTHTRRRWAQQSDGGDGTPSTTGRRQLHHSVVRLESPVLLRTADHWVDLCKYRPQISASSPNDNRFSFLLAPTKFH
jgi:hypothetical protein